MASTIESLTGITIKSPHFSGTHRFDLFRTANPDKKGKDKDPSEAYINARVCLLFGANGSGKSTIAKGFWNYANAVENPEVEVNLMSGDAWIHLSPEARAKKIFVFDENYIEQSVRIRGAGLDSIVLFDKQIDLDKQIDETEKSIADNKKTLDTLVEAYQNFLNIKDKSSPSYWRKAAQDLLKDDNGWAGIKGRKINRHRNNAKVNDQEVDRIGVLKPRRDLLDTKSAFDSLFSTYTRIDETAQRIPQIVPQLRFDPMLEVKTAASLASCPQRQELTPREAQLLQLFDIRIISSARGFLADRRQTTCPHCLQSVSDVYRVKTLVEIERILNPEVESFKRDLEALSIQEIAVDAFRPYRTLDRQVYDHVVSSIALFNDAAAAHNALIQQKIAEPFAPLEYRPKDSICNAYTQLNNALTQLEATRRAYNRIVDDVEAAKNELLLLNDELAHYTIHENYENLLRCKQEMVKSSQTIQNHTDTDRDLRKKLDLLNAKRKNFKVAADQINRSLEYIFCSKDRLELELGEDHLYHLKSRGQSVNPNNISCGERNALALCYFFTQIANESDERNLYASECLLVIDDPVSSFDFENKIGILTFLRMKFSQILMACATTKIMVSTHDISVLLNLSDAVADITKDKRIKAPLNHVLLVNKQIAPFPKKKYNEYTRLLDAIYAYAKDYNPDMDLMIGNIMRRALEAFSSFSYKKGISDVSLDANILNTLPNDHIRNYFQNSMYRLVLHGESHFEDAVRCAPESTFFSRLSTDEKQRTARDILCFIYQLNALHLLSHLPNAQKDLDRWCDQISGRAAT